MVNIPIWQYLTSQAVVLHTVLNLSFSGIDEEKITKSSQTWNGIPSPWYHRCWSCRLVSQVLVFSCCLKFTWESTIGCLGLMRCPMFVFNKNNDYTWACDSHTVRQLLGDQHQNFMKHRSGMYYSRPRFNILHITS